MLNTAIYSFSYERSLSERNARCGHPFTYQIVWEHPFCGLCFLIDGYQQGLPMALHRSKSLAENGNPAQSGALQSHVRVVEGLLLPSEGQTLKDFSRAREQYMGSKPAPTTFPVASALWEMCGKQPPLAKPLLLAVVQQKPHVDIAVELDLSLWRLVSTLKKGISMATNLVRKYDGPRYA